MTVLDPISDVNGVELFRFSKLYDFPDFVKQASLEQTIKPASDLSPTVYADQVNRRYPCHTPAATWLSALYFSEKAASMDPSQASRIKRAIAQNITFWGIADAVDSIANQQDERQKQAEANLTDSDYAIVWQDESGNKSRHCRMTNTLEVKAAADWLAQYRDSFTYQDRFTIATKILEKAAAYGCSLGEVETFIEKQAGRGFCNPSEVVDLLVKRARLASNKEHREGILKLASNVKAAPQVALSCDTLCKLAATVEGIDRTIGLFGKYTEALPRPEDVLFKVSYKEARAGANSAVALTTGNTYDREHFEKISLEDIRDLMGSDFAHEVSDGLNVDTEKLAALAGTLPMDDAELFEKLLTASGIPPIRKTARDGHEDQLVELASQY